MSTTTTTLTHCPPRKSKKPPQTSKHDTHVNISECMYVYSFQSPHLHVYLPIFPYFPVYFQANGTGRIRRHNSALIYMRANLAGKRGRKCNSFFYFKYEIGMHVHFFLFNSVSYSLRLFGSERSG